MRTTSTAVTALSVLFGLLAACGDERVDAPAATRRVDAVAAPSSDAPPTPAADSARVAPAPTTPVATPATAATPAVTAAPVAPRAPSGLRLVGSTFTHGVEARRPVDEARSFEVGERATLHLVVENLGAPRVVTIEWLRGETVLGRTTLEVGTSRTWRTWAYHRVTTRDAEAGVNARVVDPDGQLLGTARAAVVATRPAV
jgi:hypothetical protein